MLLFFMLLVVSDSQWYTHPTALKGLARLIAYPLALVAAAVAGWQRKRMQKIGLEWPSVEGCVQFVNVDPIDNSSDHAVTLEYSYFVEEYRSGSYKQAFKLEEDANNFAEAMKDKKVPIHYNPKKPDQSVLEDDDIEQFARRNPHFG